MVIRLVFAGWIGLLAMAVLPAAAAETLKASQTVLTPDGGRFTGTLAGGAFDGNGRIEWKNGARYTGGFVDGLFSGQGRFRSATGDVFEGQFENGMPNGSGTYTAQTGSVYSGQFRNGHVEGPGRAEDRAGNRYEGEFKNDLYHGQGHFVSADREYTGEFRQGEFSGKGKLQLKNGRVYEGDFVGGEFEGQGQFSIPEGPTYRGDFVAGSFVGKGFVTFPNGARQEGHFRDWKLDGAGKYTDPQGNTYEGNFKAGQLVGVATVSRTDGLKYEGELRNWMPHGVGKLHLSDGQVFTGGFSYGEYSGQGTLKYAKPQSDGRIQDTGVWEYGKLKSRVEEEQRRARANAEQALYTQVEQLNKALRELKPRADNTVNMYLLAVAGDGTQEVFRREVDFVRAQFDEKFATQGHGVSLINSRNTVGLNPLATVTSIREAISGIAGKMDKESDILFMFLTSHGSKDGTLSLQLDGVRLPELSATDLAAAFRESGIRWKVVVVSACYAGSFIEPLRDSGTLVITAARADRNSFGCADDNEFTHFGKAYFKESLPLAASFEEAFAKASRLITEWEDREVADQKSSESTQQGNDDSALDRHSLPQMEAPEAIRQQLKIWREQFLRTNRQKKTK